MVAVYTVTIDVKWGVPVRIIATGQAVAMQLSQASELAAKRTLSRMIHGRLRRLSTLECQLGQTSSEIFGVDFVEVLELYMDATGYDPPHYEAVCMSSSKFRVSATVGDAIVTAVGNTAETAKSGAAGDMLFLLCSKSDSDVERCRAIRACIDRRERDLFTVQENQVKRAALERERSQMLPCDSVLSSWSCNIC